MSKPDLYLVKVADGLLAPVPGDHYSAEIVAKLGNGELLHGQFAKSRDPIRHRKFFAMLGVAFEAFEPREGAPAKEFEQFRSDITILAGFYDRWIGVDGTERVQAKSISWASMDELEFRRVYAAVADVLIQYVLTNYTREDLDAVVSELMDFT